jgi:hypothetical protein
VAGKRSGGCSGNCGSVHGREEEGAAKIKVCLTNSMSSILVLSLKLPEQ